MKYSKITKIISGGQTGADMGGLIAARKLGIPTGGKAPKFFRTESGTNPELKTVFGLEETDDFDYKKRTEENIRNSNGTVIFAEQTSAGSILTLKLCKALNKPHIVSPSPDSFTAWLEKNNIHVLNVAGNRESVSQGITKRVEQFILLTITK